MAEREILQNPVGVGGMHDLRAAKRAPALGDLGLRQVAAAGSGAQHLSAGRDLKALGHRFLRLDAFGTSHSSTF